MNSRFAIPKAMFILCLMTNCTLYQSVKMRKAIAISETDYLVEIPFDYHADHILIPVAIGGKMYTFVYDTGADITIVNEQLSKRLITSKAKKIKLGDSQNNKENLGMFAIPSLWIGKIEFTQVRAASADLSGVLQNHHGCTQIDGILGNDLMRLAKWKINYANETLAFSDDINKLLVQKVDHELDLDAGKSGHPYVEVQIGKRKVDFTIDSGSTGGISCSEKTYKKLTKGSPPLDSTEFKGYAGGGIYGNSYGTNMYYYHDRIGIDQVQLTNKIIRVKSTSSSDLIGNKVLENYIATMDWDEEKLYLSKVKPIQPDTLFGFQKSFLVQYDEAKLTLIHQKTDHLLDLEVEEDHKVLKVNSVDISVFDKAGLCVFYEHIFEDMLKEDSMSLTIQNGSDTVEVVLTRKVLLPK